MDVHDTPERKPSSLDLIYSFVSGFVTGFLLMAGAALILAWVLAMGRDSE